MVSSTECELTASTKRSASMALAGPDDAQAFPIKATLPQPNKKTKGEVSREHILQLGARMFANAQYKDATMRDIAREGGISLGGVYFHFKSKDELIGAIIERSVRASHDRTAAALRSLPPTATSREKLTVAIHAYIAITLSAGDFPLTNRHLQDNGAPAHISAEYIVAREAHRRLWLDLLVEGQADGTLKADMPPMLMFFFLLGAMNWVAEWYDPKRLPIDSIGEYFSRFFLNGLAASP